MKFALSLATLLLMCSMSGCGGDTSSQNSSGQSGRSGAQGRPGGGPGRPGPPGAGGPGTALAAVPVEVSTVSRRTISSYIETNGVLEAENDVELVSRTSGPVVELSAEEGMVVKKGQVLARLDQDEIRAQLEISRVNLEEAEVAHDRAQRLNESNLLSGEELDQAVARFESARAAFEGNKIQLGYTEITAPFDGIIADRMIKLAETVAINQPLFRLVDFDPLLCRIQIPERELPRLEPGQRAYLTAEPWPDDRFSATVLRISPVIEQATGTVRVTLEVAAAGKLRPGMFAKIFVETEARQDVIVIPRAAIALDSLGDTVYVAGSTGESGAVAVRRDIELGIRESDTVEVLSGLSEGDSVVVVGQDGLSDGTPIQVLAPAGRARPGAGEVMTASTSNHPASRSERGSSAGPREGFDPAEMTPERLARMKERMKARGLTDEQIEERLKRFQKTD